MVIGEYGGQLPQGGEQGMFEKPCLSGKMDLEHTQSGKVIVWRKRKAEHVQGDLPLCKISGQRCPEPVDRGEQLLLLMMHDNMETKKNCQIA